MPNPENDLRKLIKDRYRSLSAFAEAVGIPKPTLYSAVGNIAGTTIATAMPIAKGLGLDPIALAEGRLQPADAGKSVSVPVYELADIDASRSAADVHARSFPVPAELVANHTDAFMLVQPDDAVNRVMPKGFLVLVAPCQEFSESGKLYALTVRSADEQPQTAIRRVTALHNGLNLAPDSTDPTYKPMVVDFSEEGAMKVTPIGRVIWFCAPLDWCEQFPSR